MLFFDDYCAKSILKAKSEENFKADKNLLNRLIDEPNLSQKDIRNELIVHLGASTETAAVGEAWALYLLARHPKVLNKVRAEISRVTGDKALKGEHTYQLNYTEQVIKESMRLYPPSYASLRDCIEEDEIQGVKIKKGDSFLISLFALNRHPKYWEQPDEFIPERFDPENKTPVPSNCYHPYGVGKHHCIGRYFATPMMVLTIAQICRHFDFEWMEKGHKHPLSLSTLKPKNGMVMRFTKRT